MPCSAITGANLEGTAAYPGRNNATPNVEAGGDTRAAGGVATLVAGQAKVGTAAVAGRGALADVAAGAVAGVEATKEARAMTRVKAEVGEAVTKLAR
ncbi:hypothetical protein E2562_034476 [Oryza meyeriana var. granulata]|uniref:Uncharacterized protein n=1 Tax=Oryza meyeriana var. granulata TaxID=110450 RepID=A0A6G1ESG2_9ORYZ|nr:hypothetical protein E2562_034476 [Oryza meyeriana var. granulata]